MDKKELGKELDRLVSLVVRNSENKCFTCGKRLKFKQRQAGHYIPRGVSRLRWNLHNVHVQCNHCNVDLGGNLKEYSKRLDPKTRAWLDDCYERYKKGRLPALNTTEMRIWRNVLKSFLKEVQHK